MNRHETNRSPNDNQRPSTWPEALPQSDLPSLEAVRLLDSRCPSASTWLNLLFGRFILRACPCGSKVDSCKGCQLGPLCQCAHTHVQSAARVESNFWLGLAFAVGFVFYSVLTAMQHHP